MFLMFTRKSFPGGSDGVFTIDKDTWEITAANNFILHAV